MKMKQMQKENKKRGKEKPIKDSIEGVFLPP
jgi:hypothetical protein